MSYRIKGWTKFQHYQSGKNAGKRPPWIKLYTELLDDIEFNKLDDKAAKTLILLWALASEYDGELPSIPEIAFRLRRSEKEIISILGRLPHWLDGVSYDNPRTDIEEDIEEDREKEVGAKAPSRAHQIPKDWVPTENHFSQADKLGFGARQVRDMAEDMRLWAGAKGAVKVNWDLAFSGWMRRQNSPQNGHASPPRNGAGLKAPLQFKPEAKEIVKPPPEDRERQLQRLLKARAM
jgi:hypothetical protein